ncbi:MAG: hypothetical protein ACRDZM_05485 [Acidimicrobiia bacterium]
MRTVWLALALVVATGGILVGIIGPAMAGGDRLWPVVWLLWAPVGFLILSKRPGNGVGAASLLIGTTWGAGFALLTLSAVLPPGPAPAWVELADTLLGVAPWLAIIWLLLVFPSGGLAGRSERVVGLLLAGFGAVATLGFAVDSSPMEMTGLVSPLAVPALAGIASAITGDESFLVVMALVLAAVVLLVTRWHRSTGVERLQYRWLLMGAGVFLVVTTAGQFLPEDSALDWLWLVGGAAIPIAIGVAVLRFRLYDIDRLISRTVGYLLVVGLFAVVFFGLVTAVSSLLQTESDLAIAASTLAVAALFNPIRKRVQTWVDRRFNRSRYDAQRVMDRFAGSLQDRVDSDEVVRGWVGVVSETMEPASVAIWMREK